MIPLYGTAPFPSRLLIAAAAVAALGTTGHYANAQGTTAAPVLRLTWTDYVSLVGRENLDYAAQAFSVPIAEAQLSVARLYPNPAVSWGLSADASGQRQATSYTIGLTQTILLGGKRGARGDVARGQMEASKAQLDDFLRTLLATAADAYIDAVHAEQVYLRKRQSADDLDSLVALNAHRVQAGDLGEVNLLQSRVDAVRFRADVLGAANDLRSARLTMTGLLLARRTDTLVAPSVAGDLATFASAPAPSARADTTSVRPEFPTATAFPVGLDLDSLVVAAVNSRPDVLAARRLRESAAAGVRVAQGNRVPDVDLSVGTQYFGLGTNAIDPTPRFSSINVGLAVPLLFSDFTHGELAASRYTLQQAERTAQSTEWKAAIEIRRAWARYEAGAAQAAQYVGSVLSDAERVRRAQLFSYQHGAASLLEVLQAERDVNDVYLAAYDAQAAYAHAVVALGQATGNWPAIAVALSRGVGR